MRRRLIASLCLAAALLVSSIQIHEAASSPLWSVTVERSGTLAASLRCVPAGEGQAPALSWAGNDERLFLDVIDLRGVPTGWRVLVSADEPGGLTLRPESIHTWIGNPELEAMETFALVPAATVPGLLWRANAPHGDGYYTLALDPSRPSGPPTRNTTRTTLILDLQGDAP